MLSKFIELIKLEKEKIEDKIPAPFEIVSKAKEIVENDSITVSEIFEIYPYIEKSVKIEHSFEKLESYEKFIKENENNKALKYQVEKCREELNKALLSVKAACTVLHANASGQKELYIKHDLYSNIISIEDEERVIDHEFILLILECINDVDITDEEKRNLALEIIKANAEKIKKEYDDEIRIEEEQIEVPEVEEEIIDEDLQRILKDLKEISITSRSKNEDIDIIYEFILQEKNLNSRLELYEMIDNLDSRLALIICDLREIIFPMIESGKLDPKEEKENLSKILKYYNEIKSKNENLKDFTITTVDMIKEIGLNDQVEVYNLSQGLLLEANELLIGNSGIVGEEYERIFNATEKLKKALTEYLEIIGYLYHSSENRKDKDAFQQEFIALREACYGLRNEISPKENDEVYIKLADEFYSKYNKNFIVFIGDNSSYVLDDLDELLGNDLSVITAFENLLNHIGSIDLFAQGYHKLKADGYSDDFLKKHMLKSIKISNRSRGRLYCGLSTIKQTYPELHDITHIAFAYGFGDGYVESKIKDNYIEEACRRCDKHSKETQEILDLLNTDWDSLTPQEFELRRSKLEEFIRVQKIKLGKALSKGIQKKGNGEAKVISNE